MTTTNFFQSQFYVNVSDEQVATALLLSGVDDAADVALADLTEEQRQLTRAHLLRMIVESYVSGSEKTASGEFSREFSTGSLTTVQINAMRAESNRIFKQYGQTSYVQNVCAINVYDDEHE